MHAVLKDLRIELLEEVLVIERHVVEPLVDVKKALEPVKRCLKKRENRKLDYERYLKETEGLRRKGARTDR